MIDAATIGITLALNNGVSDGIAQIRRELAALDGAVAASSAGLTALTVQGAGLAVPARVAAALLPAQPRAMPATAMHNETTAVTTPVMAVEPVSAPATSVAPRTSAPAATTERAPAVPPLPDFAPFGRALAALPGTDMDRPVPARGQGVVPVAAMDPAPPPSALPAAPVTIAVPANVPLPQPALRQASAPFAAPAPVSLPSRGDAPGLPDRREAPRAEGAGAATGPVEITLDGTVLARWVSASLAADASRAPAGATAFDPRLSPAWMGS